MNLIFSSELQKFLSQLHHTNLQYRAGNVTLILKQKVFNLVVHYSKEIEMMLFEHPYSEGQ